MSQVLILAGAVVAVLSPVSLMMVLEFPEVGLVLALVVFPAALGYASARLAIGRKEVRWLGGASSFLLGALVVIGSFYTLGTLWPDAVGAAGTDQKEGVFIALVLICAVLTSLATSVAVGAWLYRLRTR